MTTLTLLSWKFSLLTLKSVLCRRRSKTEALLSPLAVLDQLLVEWGTHRRKAWPLHLATLLLDLASLLLHVAELGEALLTLLLTRSAARQEHLCLLHEGWVEVTGVGPLLYRQRPFPPVEIATVVRVELLQQRGDPRGTVLGRRLTLGGAGRHRQFVFRFVNLSVPIGVELPEQLPMEVECPFNFKVLRGDSRRRQAGGRQGSQQQPSASSRPHRTLLPFR